MKSRIVTAWDERVIEALAGTLVDALQRPDFRDAVVDLVDGVVGRYRERMGAYRSFLIGLANVLGLIDRERLVSALHAALRRVVDDPDDPLRRRHSEVLAELPARLRAEPELAARVEAAKAELLSSPAMTKLVDDVAAGLHRALVSDREWSIGARRLAHRSDRAHPRAGRVRRCAPAEPRPVAQGAGDRARRALPAPDRRLHRARGPCAGARGRRRGR